MKVRPCSLYIENFRNFKNTSFDLGKKITVISGQNGVGKSNILSLIASGSGVSTKSMFGSNFQPEFTDFFNIDISENFENYKLYINYCEENGKAALTKRLSFKNDTKSDRGIRIIPRTSNYFDQSGLSLKDYSKIVKEKYDLGADGRVKIPTIYLSLSRLYPLGERKETVKISQINKKNLLYREQANKKYREWYNAVIPDSIVNDASLSIIKKNECSRSSLHMELLNTPTLSQSIGQDNIGNIISALVDIYILTKQRNYDGSILCIDEIDVSLHPDTQIRLLRLFERLATEYSIQFVLTTHSLTILKEVLKRNRKAPIDYNVVYIKNPPAPYVTVNQSYELLKADMFGNLSFTTPKVKMYFEDDVGNILFEELFKSFKTIFYKINDQRDSAILRNSVDVTDFKNINEQIISLQDMLGFEGKINYISTHIGCEELFDISNADSYFKRVIFMLDGDARYKNPTQKPKIAEYLGKKYDQNSLRLNDRKHEKNICFLPNYFAPESFLYKIIYTLINSPLEYYDFWRSLDMSEDTALFTADKIKNLFSELPDKFDNNDLKKIFGDATSKVWNFILLSNILVYYYSDYKTVGELIQFIVDIKNAFNMAYPLTLENRY